MGQVINVLGGAIEALLNRLDRYQRTHRTAGFLFAVFKKYSDDEAGHKAALLAYYGFLALFPLLLVLTSVVTLLVQNNAQFSDRIIEAALAYFPVAGHDLQNSIQGLNKSGMALAVGILLTLFG